jgi:hypothetical protein
LSLDVGAEIVVEYRTISEPGRDLKLGRALNVTW